MSLTVTDQFCGAGGSSIGAEQAGLRLRLGLNHWKLAIETHNTNFPDADHDCTDVSACDPRRYPSTDILLTSPECTNHTLAKGAKRKPVTAPSLFDEKPLDDAAAERSRATMWDVVRFAEYHGYKAIVVENVVDAYWWGPRRPGFKMGDGSLFEAWLGAMRALGYNHRIVFLNSMFAPPTPQSRDRMYCVFWRDGQLAPDLDFTATAWCGTCEKVVEARQSWKKPLTPWGKYGQQYVYVCPDCNRQAVPGAHAAATAIDWTVLGERIGDRTRPLAAATMERIRRGVEKYGLAGLQVKTLAEGRGAEAKPLTTPFVTQTARAELGLLLPVAANRNERTPGSRVDETDKPFRTMTGTSDRALVVPLRNHGVVEDAQLAPVPTVCASGNHHGLIVAKGGGSMPHPVDEPLPAVTTIPQIRMLVGSNMAHGVPKPADECPTDVVTTGNKLYALTPPEALVVRNNGSKSDSGWESTPAGEPLRALTATPTTSLVIPYHSKGDAKPVEEPLGTVDTRDRYAVVDVDEFIDDCTFRMLQPHEIAAAMQMHEAADGGEYVVLGTKRERVAQYGNAVTPPVMRMLLERVVESLEPAGIARAA